MQRYTILNLKQKFSEIGVPDLYSYFPADRLAKLIQFTCLISVMFASKHTCLSERLFSLMSDEDMNMSIMTQELEPNICKSNASKLFCLSRKIIWRTKQTR